MRREPRHVVHRPPDAEWLATELAALDRMLEAGTFVEATVRARSARQALEGDRGCGSRWHDPDGACRPCGAIDAAVDRLFERELAARIRGLFDAHADVWKQEVLAHVQ